MKKISIKNYIFFELWGTVAKIIRDFDENVGDCIGFEGKCVGETLRIGKKKSTRFLSHYNLPQGHHSPSTMIEPIQIPRAHFDNTQSKFRINPREF